MDRPENGAVSVEGFCDGYGDGSGDDDGDGYVSRL